MRNGTKIVVLCFILVFLLGIFLFFGSPASAQSPTPTPTPVPVSLSEVRIIFPPDDQIIIFAKILFPVFALIISYLLYFNQRLILGYAFLFFALRDLALDVYALWFVSFAVVFTLADFLYHLAKGVRRDD